MGDSDEEYDRRRGRDKFRGERNDYDNRRPPPRPYERARGDRPRGPHEGGWENKRREYYGRESHHDRRDSFGRNSSPPAKRTRRDWDDHGGWRGGAETNTPICHENKSSSPPLMCFKEFLMQQEYEIDEQEAVRRYQEYKVEFKRTQINDFFVVHKDKEWLKEKYHPVESVERKTLVRRGLQKRLRVFLDLYEAGYINDISLTITASDKVLKFLDRVIVKLEGGSDEEVKALDVPPSNKDETRKSDEPDPDGKDGDMQEDGKEPLPPGMEDTENEPSETQEENTTVNLSETIEEQKTTSNESYIYDGLHVQRPVALFMRNIQTKVSRNDLIAVCKHYPGYMRLALSEPSSDRRWARRAWATFMSSVNIKDICWNLSNIRVQDCELAPVVNRDVTNRIRPVNGVTCTLEAMRLDMKFALDLMKSLDSKYRLYELNKSTESIKEEEPQGEEEEEEEKNAEENGESMVEGSDGTKDNVKEEPSEENEIHLPECNPILKLLPSLLQDVSFPLEITDEDDGKKEINVGLDEDVSKSLDLLLLYLRVVHCVDYYNGNEYIHEDEMPMRCAIMHVRDKPPSVTCKNEINEWFLSIQSKLSHILHGEEVATDEEIKKLGQKDEETEVENFIKANTHEVAPDKWLCPLSMKKFRGPDYIRKHIMTKHAASVENVKTEVKFFNNYVADPKRPCFPDPKLKQAPVTRPYAVPSTPQQPTLSETYGRVSTYPPKQRRGSSFRDRKMIRYKDWDAPSEENDFF